MEYRTRKKYVFLYPYEIVSRKMNHTKRLSKANIIISLILKSKKIVFFLSTKSKQVSCLLPHNKLWRILTLHVSLRQNARKTLSQPRLTPNFRQGSITTFFIALTILYSESARACSVSLLRLAYSARILIFSAPWCDAFHH